MDVSDIQVTGEEFSLEIQKKINTKLSLPCSFGISTNKLVAKIANDYGKVSSKREGPPNAITAVLPGREAEFLAPLPAIALWGIGPKTSQRLADLGIHRIGDIANLNENDAKLHFGNFGKELVLRAKGIDDRSNA